ncbi:HpcH/HpaI aldolase/citrate lyase family protein [Sphingobium sp. LSP13-1-1.1]|uniref:HpcH/HpaI aldolase/citrate lyase family protein n=1 Tax=Sphingobium sp. LSP13-1-1.1 TaxID=3135234 RepID=UPI0034485DCC
MKLRSLLFVPADRPERFAKAVASGADAIILDLEDSVAPERKAYGRAAMTEWLASPRDCLAFVRINPLDGDDSRDDLDAVLPASPDGIMLPKAEGADSIRALIARAGGADLPPVLPIATETAAAIFEMGTFRQVSDRLAGLSWGAEDLPASIGASTSREEDGRYTAPFEMVRSLTLFAAHAAGVPAVDTIFPRIEAMDDLKAYIGRARRDGFTGMMAIHPVQIAAINQGFTPSEAEIARARAVIDAFAANPGAGVLKLDGRMIDRPHLIQAQRVLAAGE